MALWYVDNSVGSSGAGTSWGAAWKDFSNIVWASVAAGDTIYISGGSTSQTYNTSLLAIGKSGGAGNPITIDSGANAPSPKSGTVIIDGTTTSSSGGAGIIDNGGFTNFVVKNLTIQNCFERCVYIHGVSSGDVTIQNCILHTGDGIVQKVATSATTSTSSAVLHFTSGTIPLHATYATNNSGVENLTNQSSILTNGNNYITASTATTLTMAENASATVQIGDLIGIANTNARGFYISSNTGGTIHILNNYADTPSLSPAQTDTWFSQSNTSCIITCSGNTFIVNNADGAWHSDCIQSDSDNNITWKNNFLSHPNGGYNNHGAILDEPPNGATIYFYNNIVVGGGGSLAEKCIVRQNTGGTTGVVKIWNNTIWAQYMGIEYFGTTPSGDEFKNNIIYVPASAESGAVPYGLDTANLTSASTIDYNVVYTLAGNGIANVNGVGNGRSWAQWQAAGYDAHGVNSNPLFIGAPVASTTNPQLFWPSSNSPAINAGVTVATVTNDFNNGPRPVGASYDIGAFEYTSPPVGLTTSVPVVYPVAYPVSYNK